MRCPKCKSKNISVLDTQSCYESFTFRYRKCGRCNSIWQTKETVIEGSVKGSKNQKVPIIKGDKVITKLINIMW